MKIAHLINNLMGGGAQNLLASLAISQAQNDNRITIIVIDDVNDKYCRKMHTKLINNGVNVYYLNRTVGSKRSYVQTLISFVKYMNKGKFDILNTHLTMPHIYGGFAKLFAKNFKHVLTIHSSPEPWGIINKLLNSNKPIIFCSNTSFKKREQKNSISCVIDNGIIVNNNIKVVSDIRIELNLTKQSFLVILVAALRPEKNYNLVSEIAKKINNRNIHFLICGSLTSKTHIDADFLRNRSNIHILGLRSDVNQLLKQSDLFMSCSLKEGLPISLLEALFSGIPCLLSPIDPHKNVVENLEECYIPDTFDKVGFISILDKLVESNKIDKKMIFNNRLPKIVKYDIINTSNKYIEFYNRISENIS